MGGAGGAQCGEGEPAHQIDIDCQLPLRRLVADIFEAVSSLEPYGTSFSEPVFVSSPVRWEDVVKRLIADGATRFVELGPGTVLAGLIKKIDRGVSVASVEDEAGLEAALRS